MAGEPAAPPPQLVLAFDFGTRRIGLASGDTLTRTAEVQLELASAIASSSVSTVPRVVSPTCAVAGAGKRALARASATSTVNRIGGNPQ